MSLSKATISRETFENVSAFVAFGLPTQTLGHFFRFVMVHHRPFCTGDERTTHELNLKKRLTDCASAFRPPAQRGPTKRANFARPLIALA